MGHRLEEIENVCMTVPEVAEAAVVPVADPVKGHVVDVYVSVNAGSHDAPEVGAKVIKACEDIVGKIARPHEVHVVPDMPKTRSGKIMRRVLAAISNGRDVGDVTTLANADVVEKIRTLVQGKHTKAWAGRDEEQ